MRTFILINFIFLMLTINVFSQDCQRSIELEKEVNLGNMNAILEAGNSGEKCLIPYLQKLAAYDNVYSEIALAKLGNEVALKKILVEFDEQIAEPDPNTKKKGIAKLAMVGGRIAYKKFYETLVGFHPIPKTISNRNERKTYDRYEVPQLYAFLYYLSKLTGHKVIVPRNQHNIWTYQITKWKEWFDTHKELTADS